MTGMELSGNYYERCGREMLLRQFPALFPRMAIGLIGEGSECFGFDDELSRDHDWGPSFCIWLQKEDFVRWGNEVQAAYDDLPDDWNGYPARKATHQGKGRVGVLCAQDWYRYYTGAAEGPETLQQWRRVPEAFLATASNGVVFSDPLGSFTTVRQKLLDFYPEDVRLKRIAARAAIMAQSGQYNLPRSLARGDTVAATLALAEFLRAGMSMVYLMNRRYAPFYKWMHRGMRGLPVLSRTYGLFENLGSSSLPESRKIVERICALVVGELARQELTARKDTFLEAHCKDVLEHIQDEELRQSHVMEE